MPERGISRQDVKCALNQLSFVTYGLLYVLLSLVRKIRQHGKELR